MPPRGAQWISYTYIEWMVSGYNPTNEDHYVAIILCLCSCIACLFRYGCSILIFAYNLLRVVVVYEHYLICILSISAYCLHIVCSEHFLSILAINRAPSYSSTYNHIIITHYLQTELRLHVSNVPRYMDMNMDVFNILF